MIKALSSSNPGKEVNEDPKFSNVCPKKRYRLPEPANNKTLIKPSQWESIEIFADYEKDYQTDHLIAKL